MKQDNLHVAVSGSVHQASGKKTYIKPEMKEQEPLQRSATSVYYYVVYYYL